jgi:hypothetical protein
MILDMFPGLDQSRVLEECEKHNWNIQEAASIFLKSGEAELDIPERRADERPLQADGFEVDGGKKIYGDGSSANTNTYSGLEALMQSYDTAVSQGTTDSLSFRDTGGASEGGEDKDDLCMSMSCSGDKSFSDIHMAIQLIFFGDLEMQAQVRCTYSVKSCV